MEIRELTKEEKQTLHLKNEPFLVYGRVVPSLKDGLWSYKIEKFLEKDCYEMVFPDEESYPLNAKVIGAFKDKKLIGLSVLEEGMYRYMYLSDLKVKSTYRKLGVGTSLIKTSLKLAKELGYIGLYTICQDNNLGAATFYLKNHFIIGGFDNQIYRGTAQEGKSDILFYLSVKE